jgi:serine/threonine-protein kinase HipA
MKYNPADIVHVSMHDRKVGRLALVERRIYFEYDPAFIETGLQISPFKLPLQSGAIACDDQLFEGLFGVFNDSLPDGWGRLLLDRNLRNHGIAPEQLTALERLTHVGMNGMGALCYEPDSSAKESGEETLNLDTLAHETQKVLEGESEDIFPELLQLASSSAGARPKVMVGVSANRKHMIHGNDALSDGYSYWLVKFASSADTKDIGAVEYAYSLMARAAGLDMPETTLFTGKTGKGYFGVERFDRVSDQRIHMHSLCGLLHADHRLPSLDYEAVLRATLTLTRNVKELEKVFRLAVFNVLAHNRDDHSKNFAYLMQPDGAWQLAPAYDLTFSSGPGGEQSMTVVGEGKAPGKEQLLELAKKFDIKHAPNIIDEVKEAILRWRKFADEAGVSASASKQIAKVIT